MIRVPRSQKNTRSELVWPPLGEGQAFWLIRDYWNFLMEGISWTCIWRRKWSNGPQNDAIGNWGVFRILRVLNAKPQFVDHKLGYRFHLRFTKKFHQNFRYFRDTLLANEHISPLSMVLLKMMIVLHIPPLFFGFFENCLKIQIQGTESCHSTRTRVLSWQDIKKPGDKQLVRL